MASFGNGDRLARLTYSKIACCMTFTNFVHMTTLAISAHYNPESSYFVIRSEIVV
jgi:hypothetical protein